MKALLAAIEQRFGRSLVAVLGYGSLLRDDLDLYDGLFDFLVVVDSYRGAYGTSWLVPANALLPPNVFYLEADAGPRRVRSKFAVVSEGHLRRLCAPRRLQSWFWGRLSQPVMLLWTRDAEARREVRGIVLSALKRFASATVPLLRRPFSAEELFSGGLRECLRTEFRPESRGRASHLVTRDRATYEDAARNLAPSFGWIVEERSDGPLYQAAPSRLARLFGRPVWFLRRFQGRILHVLRLMKASFTFQGGLDYLAWKIERHSGVRIEISERARRHPLIFGWWILWQGRRRGGFH